MSKRILVVDDQQIVRDFFRDVAECIGEEVETADDGDIAIDICKNKHFDITFVDMRMPNMNGLDTCKAILSLDPEAKVVVMTGYTEEQMIDEALQSGAIAKIYKPFDIDLVVELIRTAGGDVDDGGDGRGGSGDPRRSPTL
jgi:DNA-binding NtrC family response regulator